MLQQLSFDYSASASASANKTTLQIARRISENEPCKPEELLGLVLDDAKAAAQLVKRFGAPGIRMLKIEDLLAEGLSIEAAAKVIAALRLAVLEEDKTFVSTPGDVFKACAEMRLLPREEFWVITLDIRNTVKSIDRMYAGCVYSASNIRAAEVFRSAILNYACKVVLVHNHPSGDPSPSSDDVSLTSVLVQAGKLLDIEVLDHVIIGQTSWVSLKEKGMFPS